MSVQVTIDRVASTIASLREMASKHVLVGIPASENARSDGLIGNAQLGYIHENGSPANNIPARPFLRPGVASIKGKAIEILKVAAKSAAGGDRTAVDKGLYKVGMIAQAAVKKAITAGEGWQPLKPATLAARRKSTKAGVKGDKPLLRTGALQGSINFIVREK
jgi:hypothetical protein